MRGDYLHFAFVIWAGLVSLTQGTTFPVKFYGNFSGCSSIRCSHDYSNGLLTFSVIDGGIICNVPGVYSLESKGLVQLFCGNRSKLPIQALNISAMANEVNLGNNCGFVSLGTSKYEGQSSYLVSHPRSGNTWTRFLIEKSTGFCSGSVLNDLRLFDMGLKCEKETQGTLLVKTHYPMYPRNLKDKGVDLSSAIVLVRNVFDVIYSFYNLEKTQKMNITLSEDVFKREAWFSYAIKSSETWAKFYSTWDRINMPKLIVRYEDMKHRPRYELLRIHVFLGITPDFQKIECAVKNTKVSDTGRQGGDIGSSLRFFPPDTRAEILRKTKVTLLKFGYDDFVQNLVH